MGGRCRCADGSIAGSEQRALKRLRGCICSKLWISYFTKGSHDSLYHGSTPRMAFNSSASLFMMHHSSSVNERDATTCGMLPQTRPAMSTSRDSHVTMTRDSHVTMTHQSKVFRTVK